MGILLAVGMSQVYQAAFYVVLAGIVATFVYIGFRSRKNRRSEIENQPDYPETLIEPDYEDDIPTKPFAGDDDPTTVFERGDR